MGKETGVLAKKGVATLAFRVKPHPDNLFSAEVMLLIDDIVVDRRESVATTIGHAIGAAENLLDGWAVEEISRDPREFFKEVML